MSELKPCPFCGGRAERIAIENDSEPSNFGGDCIQCSDCLASSRVEFGRKENIVHAWNTRAEPTPAQIMADPRVKALADAAETRVINIAAGLFPGGYDRNIAVIRAALRAIAGGGDE